MRVLRTLGAVLFVAAMAMPAIGDSGPAPYLAPANEPDASHFLPAFPAPGTKAAAGEMAVYESTRKYETSSDAALKARWALATADDNYKTPAMLSDFGCALGTVVTPETVPHLATIYDRVQKDIEAVSGSAKKSFNRTRPDIGNMEDTCVDRTIIGTGGSYPSGHTTRGWLFALILTEIAPDRSTQILARGRAYGESRVVCGAHWPSDIGAGRTTASAVFAALQSDPAFRADLEAARSELAAARAHPTAPDAQRCMVENAASAQQPW
ncbi:MAG TPA: phosphatase PAP2 family protein [Rhizomicrobium sp.]|jgi:acid phosphatase (class A)